MKFQNGEKRILQLVSDTTFIYGATCNAASAGVRVGDRVVAYRLHVWDEKVQVAETSSSSASSASASPSFTALKTPAQTSSGEANLIALRSLDATQNRNQNRNQNVTDWQEWQDFRSHELFRLWLHGPGFDGKTSVFTGNHSVFPLNLPSNTILYQLIRAYVNASLQNAKNFPRAAPAGVELRVLRRESASFPSSSSSSSQTQAAALLSSALFASGITPSSSVPNSMSGSGVPAPLSSYLADGGSGLSGGLHRPGLYGRNCDF